MSTSTSNLGTCMPMRIYSIQYRPDRCCMGLLLGTEPWRVYLRAPARRARARARGRVRNPSIAGSGCVVEIDSRRSPLERTPNEEPPPSPSSPSCITALCSIHEPLLPHRCCRFCSVSSVPVALMCDGSWGGSGSGLSHRRTCYIPDSVLCALCQSCVLSCWCTRRRHLLRTFLVCFDLPAGSPPH
jgi:hypothetical protein